MSDERGENGGDAPPVTAASEGARPVAAGESGPVDAGEDTGGSGGETEAAGEPMSTSTAGEGEPGEDGPVDTEEPTGPAADDTAGALAGPAAEAGPGDAGERDPAEPLDAGSEDEGTAELPGAAGTGGEAGDAEPADSPVSVGDVSNAGLTEQESAPGEGIPVEEGGDADSQVTGQSVGTDAAPIEPAEKGTADEGAGRAPHREHRHGGPEAGESGPGTADGGEGALAVAERTVDRAGPGPDIPEGARPESESSATGATPDSQPPAGGTDAGAQPAGSSSDYGALDRRQLGYADISARYPGDYRESAAPPPAVDRPQVSPETWVGNVNQPGLESDGRDNNCADCARAVQSTWAGEPAGAAAMSDPEAAGEPTRRMTEFAGVAPQAATMAEVKGKLNELGPGSSAIVGFDRKPGESGHWFNAVNDGGTIKAVDGQSGKSSRGRPACRALASMSQR